jgi:hypothetical protein
MFLLDAQHKAIQRGSDLTGFAGIVKMYDSAAHLNGASGLHHRIAMMGRADFMPVAGCMLLHELIPWCGVNGIWQVASTGIPAEVLRIKHLFFSLLACQLLEMGFYNFKA